MKYDNGQLIWAHILHVVYVSEKEQKWSWVQTQVFCVCPESLLYFSNHVKGITTLYNSVSITHTLVQNKCLIYSVWRPLSDIVTDGNMWPWHRCLCAP